MAIPVNGYLGDPNRTTAEFQDGIDDLTEALNEPIGGLNDKVNKSGDTMTGQLEINSATPALYLFENDNTDQNVKIQLAGGNLAFTSRDDAGASQGNALLVDVNEETRLYYNLQERLRTRTDGVIVYGQAEVSEAEPTANSHLTRKDYVDDRVLNKNWVSKFSGSSSTVVNSWGNGEFMVTLASTGSARYFVEIESNQSNSSASRLTGPGSKYFAEYANSTGRFAGITYNPSAGSYTQNPTNITQIWRAE